MTFKEAREKLKRIADGRYCSLSYKESHSSSGDLEVECAVYIGGHSFYRGPTWETAFELLRLGLKLNQEPREDVKPASDLEKMVFGTLTAGHTA
jgi:hypothetical protein